ncbi:hypothetical protein RhiirA4_486755 [Rhizophagus irregularis]|uniref:Uncharacterized protein n=1 Tax=Rhizophagus irregularis TaxID=588596 RepID=A0A2I1HRU8_9GLOM|nr:hypothetical protein RhiirA4_486755 [Rhizophagus irregularis]
MPDPWRPERTVKPYLHNKGLGRRTLKNEFRLENNAKSLETRRIWTWNDAKLLEGGLIFKEYWTNYTNWTLVEGSWTANMRNYTKILLNISVSYAKTMPKLCQKVSPFHKVLAVLANFGSFTISQFWRFSTI